MNKAKAISILVICLVLSLTSMGQDQSRKILDEVSTHLLAYSTLQADFSFSLINEEADIADTYEGNLVMQGEKFRISLMGVLAMCNGEKMWNYSEELNEATIVDPDESDFFNPVNIFTLYKKDFNLKTLSSKGAVHTIQLTPMEEQDEFSKIEITVDQQKKIIREVTYFGSDGNKYIITITNIIPDIQVDDRFFNFDISKYPGVSVYDMR